ncbi:MAG: hypothetical protein JO134_16545 [Xanthobacteraceae bacterium]|nr:hypothetical protein [Xanthobacteraceae bacterium]
MRFKPRSIPALQIALGGLPEKMRVEADADTPCTAKTVGQLRKLDTWPDNLVLTVPEQYQAAGCVRVGKANVKGRVSPKP